MNAITWNENTERLNSASILLSAIDTLKFRTKYVNRMYTLQNELYSISGQKGHNFWQNFFHRNLSRQ